MGTSRTRTAFRSLCFITCVSAHSSFFWSTEPRPVVREEALRQRRQSSFQEVERRIDEKPEQPLTEVLDPEVHKRMCANTASFEAHSFDGTDYNFFTDCSDSPSTTPSAASTTPSAASEKIVKIAKFPLGEAEGVDDFTLQEETDFEFAKAEKVLKGIQGRLLIIKDASEENRATIEKHRGEIKTQRTAFETFVTKLNQELEILRKGMKCINNGAKIIANIGDRYSFLETESGAFIDLGTALGVDDCGAIGSGEGEEAAAQKVDAIKSNKVPNDDSACENRQGATPDSDPDVWCLCNINHLKVIKEKDSCDGPGAKGDHCDWNGEMCVPKAKPTKTEAPAVPPCSTEELAAEATGKLDPQGAPRDYDSNKAICDAAGCGWSKGSDPSKDKCVKALR